MSLLLLAGLAQVDSALDEAAKVDGATFWQRLYKVTLPNMKAAIMVALLFRTLDAFRIFDNVFIMTGGSQNTSTVVAGGLQPDHQPRPRSAWARRCRCCCSSCVVGICVVFVKAFKVDLAQVKGD